MKLPSLAADYPLTANDIAAYRRDGHLLLRQVITSKEIALFRPRILELVREATRQVRPLEQRDTYGRAFLQVPHLWEKDSTIARLSLARRFGQIAADLMNVDAVRIYHDQSLVKEPGGGYTPWHQDQYYIPLDTPHVLTMWLPLVDMTAAMGTMSFASGSHHAGSLMDRPTSDETDSTFRRAIAEAGWPISPAGDLAAGDASFHAGWTVHSAPPNATDQPREAFVIVYFADGARIIERGPWQSAVGGHLPGQKPGDLAGTDINPVVFRR